MNNTFDKTLKKKKIFFLEKKKKNIYNPIMNILTYE